MIARAQRSHLVALAPLRRFRHRGWIRAGDAAMLFDALEILAAAVAELDGPARAAFQHRVGVARRKPQRAGAAESGGNALEERIGELALNRAHARGGEAREQRAHA